MIETLTTPALPVSPDAVAVRFTQAHGIYNAGEIAGFRPEVAKRLIKSGVAEPAPKKAVERPPVDRQATSPVRK